MTNRVFVVSCRICGEITGAYDPVRTREEDLGSAVKQAEKASMNIELRPGPITLHLGSCQCDHDRRANVGF